MSNRLMIEDRIKEQDRRPKSKKRIWAGVLFFLLSILFAGIFYLHSPGFKSFFFSKINNFLESRYNLSLSAESFDFNLSRLSADMENIEIRPASGRQKTQLQHFTAHKFSVNIAFSTLWGRKIRVQKLHVESPQIVLNSVRPDKTPLKGEAAPKKPLSLRIDEFLLDNGSLAIKDEKLLLSAGIANLEIEVRYGDKERLHTGFFSLESGEIRLGEKQLSLKELNGEFEFDDESVVIRKSFMRLDPLVLSASGKIQTSSKCPAMKLTSAALFI